ncbi:lipoate--protein ligase family protein [Bacteroides xylanisolvens]|jgi:lipoate-protein ligase A|uniref:lipoate--protein ligase family protein n=1 Tax=Bacteroides TaxID=816 RepID=UPI000E7576DB|nr:MULTISPECIES: lipoate--protein ligase family protein [Bacteroides]RJU59194.1 lipoate--protein ligase family protein [Bacteroides sp. AM37-9]
MIRCIYSPFTDIYFHLAAEEYLLKQGNEDIFMLWQDTPSVVIGKHQRLRSEVDQEWAEREQVHIARRFSGGGAVYHDLGNVNLTFIETTPRLPEFVTYLQRTLDFLNSMGLMATGGERLGIYLNGLKISGSAQCLYKDRVLYHCTLLYDTDLTALHQALNPEPMVDDETLSSVYAVPSVRSEVTNIRKHLSAGTVTDFKEKAFLYFSKSQSVSAFTREEIEAINQLREEKYIQKEWIYSR